MLHSEHGTPREHPKGPKGAVLISRVEHHLLANVGSGTRRKERVGEMAEERKEQGEHKRGFE